MRVEVHYDDGHVDAYAGQSLMVYVIADEGGGRQRVTLGLGGRLDAIGLCQLLVLLEMQLGECPDLLELAIELWREHRQRLLAEAARVRIETGGEDE